jgi:hypothetical protein
MMNSKTKANDQKKKKKETGHFQDQGETRMITLIWILRKLGCEAAAGQWYRLRTVPNVGLWY